MHMRMKADNSTTTLVPCSPSALTVSSGKEGLVRYDRARVGLGRLVEAPGADIDVRGHVHQVTGAGRQRAEPVGARHGARGIGRRFDRMDVVMVGTAFSRRLSVQQRCRVCPRMTAEDKP
jgi:hypothetical protein